MAKYYPDKTPNNPLGLMPMPAITSHGVTQTQWDNYVRERARRFSYNQRQKILNRNK